MGNRSASAQPEAVPVDRRAIQERRENLLRKVYRGEDLQPGERLAEVLDEYLTQYPEDVDVCFTGVKVSGGTFGPLVYAGLPPWPMSVPLSRT
jgi:predicted HAD superfamily phosphohydrolase